MKLSFDSISIANEIATKLATPKSFIFLFKHPNKLHCIWSLKESEAKDTKDDCRLTVENEKSDETGSSEFRGPNFARVYAKTNHLFFTDPFTFKFDVQHEDIRLVLIFARQSLGWKLTTLSADWNKALSDPG